MNADNLALVFGPNILSPEVEHIFIIINIAVTMRDAISLYCAPKV